MQLKIVTTEGEESFCVEVEPSTKLGRVRELVAMTEHARARKWRAKDIRLVLYGKACIKDSSDVDKKLETLIVQPTPFNVLETFLVALCPEKKRAAQPAADQTAAGAASAQAGGGAGGHYFTAATVAGALQGAVLPSDPPADGGGEDEEDDEDDEEDEDDDDDDDDNEDDESLDDADEDEEGDEDANGSPFVFSADIVMEAAQAASRDSSRPSAPATDSLEGGLAQADGAEDGEPSVGNSRVTFEISFASGGADDSATLCWKSDEGAEQQYAQVQLRATVRQETFPGHRWLLRGEQTGNVLWEGVAAGRPMVQPIVVHVRERAGGDDEGEKAN